MGWSRGLRVQAALTGCVTVAAVIASAVGSGSAATPLASGRVLALMRNAPLALSGYPSLQMHMTISVSAEGRSFSIGADALGSADGHNGEINEQLPNGAGELHMLVVDKAFYAEVTPAHYSETNGKRWAEFDAAASSASPQFSPGSATGYLQMLAGANGKIEDRGSSTMDGARVEHYRVTVNLQDALARASTQFGNANAQQAAATLGITNLPMDVWLDDKGVPRQVKFHISAQGGSGTFTMRIRGSNKPVHVTAPPASQVFHVTSIMDLTRLIAP
jgi:hypothetical protein